MCVGDPMFASHVSYPCLSLNLCIMYAVGPYKFIEYHLQLLQSQRKGEYPRW